MPVVKRVSATERLTPHFKKSELRCRCRREGCDAASMDMTFMQKVEALRVEWGLPLVPTSGARCRFWNKKVGGSPRSQHLFGMAVDFYFQDSSDAEAFVQLAEKIGFGGIGVGRHLVHVDGREGHARWTYDD